MKRFIFITLFFCFLSGCHHHHHNFIIKNRFETQKVHRKVTCLSDRNSSYCLYLPKKYATEQSLPVLIFFDSHGRGYLPVYKYKSLAGKYNIILIGSNDIKNNLDHETINRIYSSLIQEIRNNITGTNENIILAGFSGGARTAASIVNQQRPVSLLIACGAGIQEIRKTDRPLPCYLMTGIHDFNFHEIIQSEKVLKKKGMDCYVDIFKGGHEWAPAHNFQSAILWGFFNDAYKNSTLNQDSLAETICNNQIKQIENLKMSGRYLQYIRQTEFILSLTVCSQQNKKLRKELHRIENLPETKKLIQKREDILEKEKKLMGYYASLFPKKSEQWWENEIQKIQSLANNNESITEHSAQRLMSFLSILGFTYADQAIKQRKFTEAKRFLALYQLSDPENADVYLLKAAFYSVQGQQDSAIPELKKSISHGLIEPGKITGSPYFESLSELPEFRQIIEQTTARFDSIYAE